MHGPTWAHILSSMLSVPAALGCEYHLFLKDTVDNVTREDEHRDHTFATSLLQASFKLSPIKRMTTHNKHVSSAPGWMHPYGWPLFPTGKVPGKQVRFGHAERYRRPLPDALSFVCAPNHRSRGRELFNVVVPELVPFIVSKDHSNFIDMAMIIAPGGGFQRVAWQAYGDAMARWWNTQGVSAFVLKYRVPNSAWNESTGAQIMDAQRAVSLVRSRSAEFGIRPDRIGFQGDSSGGFLALSTAMSDNKYYSRIDAVDDVSHKPNFLIILYPLVPSQAFGDAAKNLPATYIAVAEDDPCVGAQQSIQLYQSMLTHKAAHADLHVFAEGGHAFGLCTPELMPDFWYEACLWTDSARAFVGTQVLGLQRPIGSGNATF